VSPLVFPAVIGCRGRPWLAAVWLVAFSFSLTPMASAFGKNKTQTRNFEWNILETAHFEIHYYPEEEALAREVCQLAEEAHQHDTSLLRERTTVKTPLFIYRNQIDFQQTNILPSVIGVGTGGFTEAFKSRVALPAPDSPKILREVIFHEFTHVLQYNVLYGEGMRSFRVYKGYLVPLWVLEGLAEYAAQDWNSQAEMEMRDAVLNNRLEPLSLLEGFGHLEDVYLAYKQSQLTIQYIAERYGEDKLATLFKKFGGQVSLSPILRETLGIGLQELNDEFFTWVRQRYLLRMSGLTWPTGYATPLDPPPVGRLHVITGGAWSPDGRYLAYVSNQDQTWRVYVKTRNQKYPAEPITSCLFETLSTRGRPLAWSPDSKQLAFVAQTEGKTLLYLLEVASRRLTSHDLPVDNFFSPAWSPRGDQIALIGVRNGVSDVYLWNPSTLEFTPLTQDREADNSPAWSPDGSWLVFTRETADLWQMMRLAMGQPGAQPEPLTHGPYDHLTPIYSADGRYLYFSAARTGEFNIYRLALDTMTWTQLTTVPTGAFLPAESPDGQQVVFTLFAKGSQDLWMMPAAQSSAREVNPDEVKTTADPTLPPLTSLAEIKPAERARLPEETELAEEDESTTEDETAVEAESKAPQASAGEETEPLIVDSRPYQFRFSPDLLFLLAGYDSSQGVIGGGYLTASDYLGDHNLSLILQFVPGYQASTQLTYANLTYPVDIFLSVIYNKYYYRLLDLETNTMIDAYNDEELGGTLELQRPFSLYDRVELGFSVSKLRREQGTAVADRNETSLRLSLVHDSTSWYDFDPANGSRRNLSVVWADRILGGMENYCLLQTNLQTYQSLDFINPFVVSSLRLLLAASVGPDHPVYLFGGIGLLPETVTIRGYRYGELIGSQIGTINAELRFPLFRNMDIALWPLDFLLVKTLQIVLFDDFGVVTNDITHVIPTDLRNAVGVGLRLHTFLMGKQLLTIRFDVAQRTGLPYGAPIFVFGMGQSF
jgi:Tol biopolymer transport system component